MCLTYPYQIVSVPDNHNYTTEEENPHNVIALIYLASTNPAIYNSASVSGTTKFCINCGDHLVIHSIFAVNVEMLLSTGGW